MRTSSPIPLSSAPPRYPLLIAALWIAGCGTFAASVAWVPLSEPFYLPAVLAVAWFYGLSWGLGAALAAAFASASSVTKRASSCFFFAITRALSSSF